MQRGGSTPQRMQQSVLLGGREGQGKAGTTWLSSTESFAELSSCLLGSYYRCHAAVNVLSTAGTWEQRVRLS